MPAGARILEVFLDMHTYYLSVMADTDQPFETRRIVGYMDGYPLPNEIDRDVYLGSCAQSGDLRRWHFFDHGVVGVAA